MQKSVAIAQQAANAATKQADASLSVSAPFLEPHIGKFRLHPAIEDLSNQSTHWPSVRLHFLNIGKTPAMLRGVAARLVLTERDRLQINPSDIDAFRRMESSSVIAPGMSGGAKIWKFGRAINADEIRALNLNDVSGHYLRFYMVGYVIYDDVFQIRHAQRFCVKLRQNEFQERKRGQEYNRVTREPL